ncbi:4Fe-4S cluster-binding domain-containing protein, partial [Staphylococcus aureus]|uniref:4Fe-4S cluster-binding domain-containing protein n=1 Tax=Staphylococcus aureus TaxID=1280 RepID=UPI00210D5C5C
MILLDIKQGQVYIAKIESNSFVDGEGVRCIVYVSGCPFNCVGCYNKASQKFRYGEKYTDEILAEI